jgi:hypothetical protein
MPHTALDLDADDLEFGTGRKHAAEILDRLLQGR